MKSNVRLRNNVQKFPKKVQIDDEKCNENYNNNYNNEKTEKKLKFSVINYLRQELMFILDPLQTHLINKIPYLSNKINLTRKLNKKQSPFLQWFCQTIFFSGYLSFFWLLGNYNFSIIWVFLIVTGSAYCESRFIARKKAIEEYQKKHRQMELETTKYERHLAKKEKFRKETQSIVTEIKKTGSFGLANSMDLQDEEKLFRHAPDATSDNTLTSCSEIDLDKTINDFAADAISLSSAKRQISQNTATSSRTNSIDIKHKTQLSTSKRPNKEQSSLVNLLDNKIEQTITKMTKKIEKYRYEEPSTFFEDTLFGMKAESCEWLNSIMSDFWPYITVFVKQILHDQVEPMITAMEPQNILKNFSFKEIHLGNLAPRIVAVNSYRPKAGCTMREMNESFENGNMARSIILNLDLDFCGETDIQVNCMMMSFGLQDMIFKGKVRIELGPLFTDPPFFASIAISFVDVPDIDFCLTGIGHICELPLLNNVLHDTIDQIISSICVLPNKIIVPLVNLDSMQKFRSEDLWKLSQMDLMHPFARGMLFIHLKRANNLVAKDHKKIMGKMIIEGKSDPFVIFRLGANKEYKSKIIYKNLDPVWDEKTCMLVTNPSLQKLKIEVWDDDTITDVPIVNKLYTVKMAEKLSLINQPDELGRLTLQVRDLCPQRINVTDSLNDIEHGELEVDYYYLPLLESYEEPEESSNSNLPNLYQKTVVNIVIETVTNIPKLVANKNPLCYMTIHSPSNVEEFEMTPILPVNSNTIENNKSIGLSEISKSNIAANKSSINFSHEFYYILPNKEKNLGHKNLTLLSSTKDKIATQTLTFDTSDTSQVYSEYENLELRYVDKRYNHLNKRGQKCVCKVGIRVRRAVGALNYQIVPEPSGSTSGQNTPVNTKTRRESENSYSVVTEKTASETTVTSNENTKINSIRESLNEKKSKFTNKLNQGSKLIKGQLKEMNPLNKFGSNASSTSLAAKDVLSKDQND